MTREEAIAAGDVRSLTKLLRAELQRNAPNIPDTLKELKIWLNWKVTKTNATSGKFDKVPFYPASQRKRHGQQGGDNDLANLGKWAEAWKAFTANPDIAGVGVAMLPEFGLVALDADKCISGGAITPIDSCISSEAPLADFDPYSTLGVAPNAPDFVVQAAYRACIKKFHPDHYKGADARQRTADILEAYRLIGTADARAQFDRLRHVRQDEQAPDETSSGNGQKNTTSEKSTSPRQTEIRKFTRSYWPILFGACLAILALLSSQNKSDQTSQTTHPGAASGWGPVVEVSSLSPSPLPSQPTAANLDEVLKFKNPSTCEMTRATEKLFAKLIIFDPPEYVGRSGPPVRIAGFEKPVVPSFSRKVGTNQGGYPRDNEATLAISGTWHGLKVSKIRVRAMEQSSFWERQIRFLEPASLVREKLNKLGFKIPAIGEFREYSGESVVSAGIGVEEIPGGSALYCGSSIYY